MCKGTLWSAAVFHPLVVPCRMFLSSSPNLQAARGVHIDCKLWTEAISTKSQIWMGVNEIKICLIFPHTPVTTFALEKGVLHWELI